MQVSDAKSLDLVPPEVLYCGFQRMSAIPHDQYYQTQATLAAANEFTVAIAINGRNRHTFTTPIHKQADIQTLARTIEALLADKNLVVACLVDLGSDNILRWSDTVEDVLDSDSVVGVIPLSELTLTRTIRTSRLPITSGTDEELPENSSNAGGRTTSPIQQMEFIQVSPVVTRSGSYNSSTMGKFDSDDTARISNRKKPDSQKSPNKAFKALKANAKRLSDIIIEPPVSEAHADLWLPPLPTSPIPKAVQTRLTEICSNAFLLLKFCQYCARKKTLCELLYWLDSSAYAVSEDYVESVYLDPGAPLRLNLPREVSTVVEARELLRDGALSWSETGFEKSPECFTAKQIEREATALFASAAITFTGPVHPERNSFLSSVTEELRSAKSTHNAKSDSSSSEHRQAVLQTVLSQYFPGTQINVDNYFAYSEMQMTKTERSKTTGQRKTYGLYDSKTRMLIEPSSASIVSSRDAERTTIMSSSPAQSFITASSRERIPDRTLPDDTIKDNNMPDSMTTPRSQARDSLTLGREQLSEVETASNLQSTNSPRATSVEQVTPVRHANGVAITRNGTSSRKSHKLASLLGHDVDSNGLVQAQTSPGQRSLQHNRSPSMVSSLISDEATNFEDRRNDTAKRQTKLRAMLGASPSQIQKAQGAKVSEELFPTHKRSNSPTPSVGSHVSAQSGRYSHISSHMSRAEKDDAADRRLQARKAAKLYAMYGSEVSESKGPSLRAKRSMSDLNHGNSRPGSSASTYSNASVGRNSVSTRHLYTPTGAPNNAAYARYKPDRGQLPPSGLRSLKTFSLFKSGRHEDIDPAEVEDEDRDSVSDFPPRAPSAMRRSPKFSSSFPPASVAPEHLAKKANEPRRPSTSSTNDEYGGLMPDTGLEDPNHDPEHQYRDFLQANTAHVATHDREELDFLQEDDEEDEDEEGEAIVQDVRTNMKLRQLLGNDAPTSNQGV